MGVIWCVMGDMFPPHTHTHTLLAVGGHNIWCPPHFLGWTKITHFNISLCFTGPGHLPTPPWTFAPRTAVIDQWGAWATTWSDLHHHRLWEGSHQCTVHVRTQGCFYYLMQVTWRKIQSLGLTTHYRTDEDVQHFIGMLDGLALRDNIPEGLDPLVDYFDQTYVTGPFRRIQQPPISDGTHPHVSHPSNVQTFPVECTWCDCEWWLSNEQHVWSMESGVKYPCGPCSSHNMDTHWISMEGFFCCRGNTMTQWHWPAPKKWVRGHTKQLWKRLVTMCKQTLLVRSHYRPPWIA